MKKILIPLLLIIFLLSGCGMYNFNNFTLPDDTDFIALVQELDTPRKVSNYMIENFTYKANPYTAISPYILWKTKIGDCNDMAAFGILAINYHGYTTYQLKIFYSDFKHQIAVYSEYNCYSITDNQYYHCCFSNFIDIVDFDSASRNTNWLKYVVYDYDNNIIEKGIK
jgi:hypothetical protein